MIWRAYNDSTAGLCLLNVEIARSVVGAFLLIVLMNTVSVYDYFENKQHLYRSEFTLPPKIPPKIVLPTQSNTSPPTKENPAVSDCQQQEDKMAKKNKKCRKRKRLPKECVKYKNSPVILNECVMKSLFSTRFLECNKFQEKSIEYMDCIMELKMLK